ncbi:hypothetical protein Sru01_67540 [Sphaerisporangium rufum]|uniref:Uncharacterized protein n=1 Tax=Sphaerisporangium rufum TaxID=1381558 RepID=A0A919RCZ9_9ACTN|nr:hypothetical protein Sru01_67540 [Sphaerisporangium rufum]
MAEHAALERLAQLFIARANAFSAEGRTAEALDIPSRDWPLAAAGCAGVYRDARNTMSEAAFAGDSATRALAGVIRTVRAHYLQAEHSSAADAGPEPQPVDSPISRSPGSDTAYTAQWLAGPATTVWAGVRLYQAVTMTGQIEAAERFMPELLPLAVGASLLLLNMRDDEPFRQAGRAWQQLVKATESHAAGIKTHTDSTLSGDWQGEGAASFARHLNDRLLPALETYRDELLALAELGDAGADAVKSATETGFKFLVEATVIIGLAVTARAMAGPTAPVAMFAVTLAWGAAVGQFLWQVGKLFAALQAVSERISTGAEDVRQAFLAGAGDLGEQSAGIKPVPGIDWIPGAGDKWTAEDWADRWRPGRDS